MELLQSMYNSDSNSNPKELVAPSAIIFYLIVLLMHIFIVSMNGLYNISQYFPIRFDSSIMPLLLHWLSIGTDQTGATATTAVVGLAIGSQKGRGSTKGTR